MKARELMDQDKAHLLGERRRQGQMMQMQSVISSLNQIDAQSLNSSHLGKLVSLPLSQFLLLNMMLTW